MHNQYLAVKFNSDFAKSIVKMNINSHSTNNKNEINFTGVLLTIFIKITFH